MPIPTGNTISCPHCGKKITLDESYVRRLAEGWRKEALPELKKELLPRLREQAESEVMKKIEAAQRDQEEENEELRRQIHRLRSEIGKLNRKVPTPRAQQLGTIHEEALAKTLAARFPEDDIRLARRGKAGGDVTQTVFSASGTKAGTILWEVKRTAKWSSAWLTKLRKDAKSGGHTVGVLVSDVATRDMSSIELLGDVWRTTFELAPALAAALRDAQIQVLSIKVGGTPTSSLRIAVYEYVTSKTFADHVRGMVQAAADMQDLLVADKKASERRWIRQERNIGKLVDEVVGVVGDFRKLGGSGVRLGIPKSELAALPSSKAS